MTTDGEHCPIFPNYRPTVLPDHFDAKSKVLERFKSYRLVYLSNEFDQNRGVCEFLNFSPLDDTLSKSSQTNANDDDDMPRSVGESNSEEYTEVDSESGSDVDDEDPSIITRYVISEQSGN